MARQIIVVDPLFTRRLAELRAQRGLSVRDLAALTHFSHTHVWELERGRKQPLPDVAAKLDQALDADGMLAALVTTAPGTDDLDADAVDRLRVVAGKPRTVDAAVVDSLTVLLAAQRRMEDSIGSAPMLAVVRAQLVVVECFASEARGPIRVPVVEIAAQWAQFLGWLNATSHEQERAKRWYATALEWATEVADTNMIATALNMRGHLAWLAGEIGPVIGLSHAAGRLPASAGTRSLALQQEARGQALAGDADATDKLLDRAVDLATAAAAHPEDEPPWIYFHNSAYLQLQRGLAYHYLGRHTQAIDLLTDGLARTAPEVRRSEWIGAYLYQLGTAYLAAGEREAAEAVYAELRDLHTATGARRLARLAAALRSRLTAVS
jgi:transcriptional regulator with XRE-family HTH domain/tetratricopeptide (TPR) repeat protein